MTLHDWLPLLVMLAIFIGAYALLRALALPVWAMMLILASVGAGMVTWMGYSGRYSNGDILFEVLFLVLALAALWASRGRPRS